MTLSVQWQPPVYDGGAPVDNYTITVTPGGSTHTIPGMSINRTLSYNMTHSISIVATNCNGSSSDVVVTITIGKLVHLFLYVYLCIFGDTFTLLGI